MWLVKSGDKKCFEVQVRCRFIKTMQYVSATMELLKRGDEKCFSNCMFTTGHGKA
jgi:hypothetical protein